VGEEGRKVLLGDQASKHIVRVLKPTWKMRDGLSMPGMNPELFGELSAWLEENTEA
jgi:hypothetical protein